MKAPIKYYGGKGGMYNTIISYFPDENKYNTYIEPFGGSGVVLLNKPKCDIEIYNDLDDNLFSLYWVLKDIDLFRSFKEQLELMYYHEGIRNHWLSIEPDNLLDKAIKFFYINRTSFNGHGGLSQVFVVRKNMSKSVRDYLSSIEKLPEFHERWSSVFVYKRDGLELIEKFDKPKTMMYLDPPYVKSSRKSDSGYNVDQEDDFHYKLVDVLNNVKEAKVLLSGYDNDIYGNLNSKWERKEFKLPNSESIEILWMNY